MSSIPGGYRSDYRRSPPPSSLSPLAAPFTAGGRDPMNPPPMGPTAPSLQYGTLQNPTRNPNFHTDGFRFSSGEDMGCPDPYYQSYGAWTRSWVSDVSGEEERASWLDPSLNYPVSPTDKGTRNTMHFSSFTEAPNAYIPFATRTNQSPNPHRFSPESSEYTGTTDPFSKDIRSSVVGPMLKELSDSFSLNSSPYDKFMYQLESSSSPTGPDPVRPCSISFDYFDFLQSEQKQPVPAAVSVPSRTRVSITSPVNTNNEIGTRNSQVKIKKPASSLEEFLTGTGTSTGGTGKIDSSDQQSVVLDSPCWKGMAFHQNQNAFFKGQSSNFSIPDISTENPNITKDKNEDTPKEEEVDPGKLETSSLNKLESVTDVKAIIKSLHDLSQVLLNSCGDNFKLDPCEYQLLQGAIENLKSCSPSSPELKTADGTGTGTGTGASSSEIHEKIKTGTDSEKVADEIVKDYKQSILQAVDKLPKEGSDVQVELYKSLWLEAEVAMCAMKYELQLAKRKIKLETPKKQTEEVESSSVLDELKSPINEKNESPKLKEFLFEEPSKDSEGQNGNLHASTNEVDDTAMARLSILKRRDEINISNANNSFYPDYYSSAPRNTSSSEWEHVVKDEL